MSSYVGIPTGNPTKYLGPGVAILSIVTRDRSPTGADIRQGTTGTYYPVGSFWIVSKAPTTGNEGDLWWLSKIVANVAYWVQVGNAALPLTIDGDVGAASGNPILLHALNGSIGSTNCGATVEFVASGNEVDLVVTNATFNTFIGQNSGNATAFANNTGLGYNSLSNLTNLNFDNVGIGAYAGNGLNSTSNIAIGSQALFGASGPITGSVNVAIGTACLENLTSGERNVGIGSNMFVLTTGSFNFAIGNLTLTQLVSGNNNIAIGSNSTFFSGHAYTTSESNNILISNEGVVGESNVMRLGTQGAGNGQVNECFVAGIVGVTVANTQMVTIDSTTGQLGVTALPAVGSFNQIVVRVFDTPGATTYTPTAGMQYCTVEVVGGGGGSGGVATTGATENAASGGGGGGGYARKTFTSATIGASQTATVGAAGAAGAAGNNIGGTGGTSSLGALIQATGGVGGFGSANVISGAFLCNAGGLGGAGSSGDFNTVGTPGGCSTILGLVLGIAGFGGSSFFGGGGRGQDNTAGFPGQSYGGGGSGPSHSENTAQAAGQPGFKGAIIITEYISS